MTLFWLVSIFSDHTTSTKHITHTGPCVGENLGCQEACDGICLSASDGVQGKYVKMDCIYIVRPSKQYFLGCTALIS